MLDSLFSNLPVLSASLDGLTQRQQAIGENVANADTPGYKRIEVSYEAKLRAAIQGDQGDGLPLEVNDARQFTLGPSANLSNFQPDVRRVTNEDYRNDKNDVDIEMEMANLANTNITYNTLATLTKDKFDDLKTIMRDIH
ncbi:MAG TPA: flagellar basal body rod protein FlgB [Oscillatoriaceae cyanobacterium]